MTEIKEDKARQRYSIFIDGMEAYLTYELPRSGLLHITHTIVPDALGGRGLGKKLVTHAVEDAIQRDARQLSSSCWFASALIEKNDDWARHLA